MNIIKHCSLVLLLSGLIAQTSLSSILCEDNVWYAKLYDSKADKVMHFELDMRKGWIMPSLNHDVVLLEVLDKKRNQYVTIQFTIGEWYLLTDDKMELRNE
jgi:hypothetical protein